MVDRMQQLKVLVLFAVVLQACSGIFPVDDEKSGSNYQIPPPPGPVENKNDSLHISPIALDNYMINPGIGWQDGPEPFGIVGFPGTVSYSNRREIAWSVLNPQEGVFDWSALERQLAQAKKQGNQFSFRVYTMVGEEYGDHMIPEWVLEKGATLLPNGEPDYSNCEYQAEWAKFVNELARLYDGNPDIAFIDISGYGNFNEWSWQDQQTEWDDVWSDQYGDGEASPQWFTTLDGQARRRLADMFIGGSFQGHECRTGDGDKAQVDYAYAGFQKTQLVMPYAGIVQSTQYVFSRRKDVGFRYDCLGFEGKPVFDKVGEMLSEIWKTAPVVFELCTPQQVDAEDATWLLQAAHGSIVHNNNWQYDKTVLEDMMKYAGYRYFLEEMNVQVDGRVMNLGMTWQNLGYAVSYPKMGQDFSLALYLLDYSGHPVFTHPFDVDISSWMPSSALPADKNFYELVQTIEVSNEVEAGKYLVAIAIIDDRTGKSIQLAMGGRDSQGYYVLFPIEIE